MPGRSVLTATSVEAFIKQPFSGLVHESKSDRVKRNRDHKYHSILKKIYGNYQESDPYENSSTSESSSCSESSESEYEEDHECTYFTCENGDCMKCVRGMNCMVCPMCDACVQWRGPCVQCVKAKPHCRALHFGFLCEDHKSKKFWEIAAKFEVKRPSDISLHKYALIQQHINSPRNTSRNYYDDMSEEDAEEEAECSCTQAVCNMKPEELSPVSTYLRYCNDADLCKKVNCTRTGLFGKCTHEQVSSEMKMLQKANTLFDIITTDHRRGCLNTLCKARDVPCVRQEKFLPSVLIKRPSKAFGSRFVDFDFLNLDEAMILRPEVNAIKPNPQQENVDEEEYLSEWEADSEYLTVTLTESIIPSVSSRVQILQPKESDLPLNFTKDVNFSEDRRLQEIEDYLKILSAPGTDDQLFMAVFDPNDKPYFKTYPLVDKMYDEMYDDDALGGASINSVTYKSDIDVAGKYEPMFEPIDRLKLFRPKMVTVGMFRTLIDLVNESPPALQLETLYHLCVNAKESEELCKELADAVFMGQLFNIRMQSMYESINRYCYYLIALATSTQKGRCVFYELGPEIMADIYHQYLSEPSLAMRRLSMKILANLVEDNTLNACGPVYLDYTKTFAALCSPDVDLRHYLLNFLTHSLKDSSAQEVILKLKEFRLTPVVIGCISRNENIRMASIRLIDQIMDATVGQDIIQDTFKEAEGIYIANELLNKPMLIRMHPYSVQMHTALQAAPNLLEEMRILGALDSFLKFLGHVFDAEQLIATLKVVLKVTMDPTSRHIVAHNNMLARISPYISHGHNELSTLACTCVAALCEKDIASTIVRQGVKFKIMPSLVEVLQGDKSWFHREEACKAIAAAIELSPILAEVFIRTPHCDLIVKTLALFRSPTEMPDYTKLQYVRIIYALIKKEVYRRFLYENLAIESLVVCLRSEHSPGGDNWLMEYVVAALGRLFKDKHAVHIFANIPDSFDALTKAFINRKCTAVLLTGLIAMIVDLLKSYSKTAINLIKSGFLNWLVQLQDKVYLPLQELLRVGINAIVCGYLPLKFSQLGYLDYKDITNVDHFYVLKQPYDIYDNKNKHPFPIITDKIPITLDPEDTIYIFKLPKFMRGVPSAELGKSDDENIILKKEQEEEIMSRFMSYALELEEDQELEPDEVDEVQAFSQLISPPIYGSQPNIKYLSHHLEEVGEGEEELSSHRFYYDIDTDDEMEDYFDYYEQIVEELTEFEMPQSELGHLMTRIIALAKVVFYTSCGTDVEMPVTQYMVKLHEAELKEETGNYILPMGVLEYRHKFERAVLFKVLADVVGVPCWLYRNDDLRIAWIEVYISTDDEVDYVTSFVTFANMKANVVLDLMSPKPPRHLFLPKDSPEAIAYTTTI